ncbi:putative cyclase-domain-containing protein [Aspergillus parasiticus]|uniref:Putative cyclase-domain-containing protein n=1 Tax=Aspergillus parasiticus TaxID=5067 RepID=A0A5N6DJ85_ASPPA|nr:putative cyclase-domain-containing protein [Aspergillus parasiticus]
MSFTKLLLSTRWFSKKFNQVEPLQTSAGSNTVSASIIPRPRFDELPLKKGHPKGSAWGLWGDHDERGTLNLITEDVVRAASAEFIQGIVVNLNLPLDVPLKPMNPRRKPCAHNLIAKGHANDDELDFNTQSSSHWDGLRHFPYSESKQFYNGVVQDEISSSHKIGIQNIAEKPIVTRGVLLDWYAYAQRKGLPHRPFTNQAITLEELLEVAREQRVTFRRGDILVIRTGWTAAYSRLSDAEKKRLGGRDDRASCGVEATEAAIRWHWEQEFSAVASDTVAYEAWPSPKPWGVCMHEVFLSGWGMPIGECWDLEGLSETCRKLGRWTFMLTSQPLNLPGGVASPPNATAIF